MSCTWIHDALVIFVANSYCVGENYVFLDGKHYYTGSSHVKCFGIDGGVKNGDVSPFLRKENEMSEELINVADVESVFSDISTMIYTAKNEVMMRVNSSVISLYWNIWKKLYDEVLQGKKAEYGKI